MLKLTKSEMERGQSVTILDICSENMGTISTLTSIRTRQVENISNLNEFKRERGQSVTVLDMCSEKCGDYLILNSIKTRQVGNISNLNVFDYDYVDIEAPQV